MRELVTIAEHTVDVSMLTLNWPVLDVGCRDFGFSRGMLARGNCVVAMDADPTVEDPNIDGVKYICSALHHKAAPRKFLMHADPQARRLVRAGEAVGGEQVDVSAITIEDVTRDFVLYVPARWDVVKLDVEGAEYDILRNWPGAIAKQISVEYHEHVFGRQPDSTYEEIHARLVSFGYEIVRHERDARHCAGYSFWDSLYALVEDAV